MLKSFATGVALITLTASGAMAAEIGVRQQNGYSVRNITHGRMDVVSVSNSQFTENSTGGSLGIDADNFAGQSEVTGRIGNNGSFRGQVIEADLDGTLSGNFATFTRNSSGNTRTRLTEGNRFSGTDRTNFSSFSTFSN